MHLPMKVLFLILEDRSPFCGANDTTALDFKAIKDP